MDQWRTHIPRNNLPKQFCDRCFEQGDRKWQQNELGLGFELVFRVWGRKMKCVAERISGGGPPWAHEAGARSRGVGAPSTLVARWLAPWCVLCSINPQIFYKKSYLIFRAFGELLFSRYFYITWIIR